MQSNIINIDFETMTYDAKMIAKFYQNLPQIIEEVRTKVIRPLTLTEKILFAHLYHRHINVEILSRGESYVNFRPDRVAMQDATAQMAVLQFMNAGRETTAVPSTIHCDHLILAHAGVDKDLPVAQTKNREVYDFLESASRKYNIGFWPAGAGIIHQVVLENYAFPGGMMVGTDSHTPNAGGLGMLAIGVGGADAVDVMTGMEWELKMPKIIGVRLSGRLSAWASPKDVILKLAGILTVKGGTNAIIEYFGEGAETISCTGKATICNMGAEVGATCSVFPYDERMATYLRATGREDVATMADANVTHLMADTEVMSCPESYYDRIIEIDLSAIEPHVNGPFTPDAAFPVSEMANRVKEQDYPDKVEVVLIGSCTNSSYEDLMRAANVAQSALARGMKPKTEIIINPGSELIRATAERDGILQIFEECGAVIMTNACGPCIGQWKRVTDDNARPNSIITTFNRNFAKRADGNPNTHAFITSPELAIGFAFTGQLSANPTTLFDFVPQGKELPQNGFTGKNTPVEAPTSTEERTKVEVIIIPNSERLQRLEPFLPCKLSDFQHLPLLIKTEGKCTTDHISMAGPWLNYRGHLENISRNLLMGAVNAFSGETNAVRNAVTNDIAEVSTTAKWYKENIGGSFVIAEDNYGEGSSREHAAMEPRFLGVKFICAKSFARIHETNLKKQGVLALTFANADDYNLVQEGDRATLLDLENFKPGSRVTIRLIHTDGSTDHIEAKHTYNEQQIQWFWRGSALNVAISHD